ncbi:MAG: SPOR domain-containing protein [Bacteroidales bacterium]|nr:SPOR domain-containing protein [Bacteroidales bacterium]
MGRILVIIISSAFLFESCNLMEKQSLMSNDIDTILDYHQDSAFMANYISREELKVIEERVKLKIDSLRQVCRDDALGINNKYHVIVGSFKVAQNADGYLTTLHMMGYNPVIIEIPNGFRLVSAASYTHYDTAVKALNSLQLSLNPEAWIYTKKN